MRAAPLTTSKVVSQALFGEEVEMESSMGGWFQIKTPDGYAGWVEDGAFTVRQKPYLSDVEITRLKAHVYACADTEFGPLFSLPYGAKIQLIDSSDIRWLKALLPDGREAYIQRGDVQVEPFSLIDFSKKFLGVPYTWGGRSSFGFDCSGYVQMLYARLGLGLPRDACQQILDPRAKPIGFEEVGLGDLVFWGGSKTDIRHVGMVLNGDEFIHTSVRENKPYVRVSLLNDFEWSGAAGAFYSFRAARRFFNLR